MRRIGSGEPCALAVEDRIGCNNQSVWRRNEEYPTASVQVSESANGKCRPLFACKRNAPSSGRQSWLLPLGATTDVPEVRL
jgi:hypothetical protein